MKILGDTCSEYMRNFSKWLSFMTLVAEVSNRECPVRVARHGWRLVDSRLFASKDLPQYEQTSLPKCFFTKQSSIHLKLTTRSISIIWSRISCKVMQILLINKAKYRIYALKRKTQIGMLQLIKPDWSKLAIRMRHKKNQALEHTFGQCNVNITKQVGSVWTLCLEEMHAFMSQSPTKKNQVNKK